MVVQNDALADQFERMEKLMVVMVKREEVETLRSSLLWCRAFRCGKVPTSARYRSSATACFP